MCINNYATMWMGVPFFVHSLLLIYFYFIYFIKQTRDPKVANMSHSNELVLNRKRTSKILLQPLAVASSRLLLTPHRDQHDYLCPQHHVERRAVHTWESTRRQTLSCPMTPSFRHDPTSRRFLWPSDFSVARLLKQFITHCSVNVLCQPTT